eukprot:10080782-Alexandrium_andersonii.AAC.1
MRREVLASHARTRAHKSSCPSGGGGAPGTAGACVHTLDSRTCNNAESCDRRPALALVLGPVCKTDLGRAGWGRAGNRSKPHQPGWSITRDRRWTVPAPSARGAALPAAPRKPRPAT